MNNALHTQRNINQCTGNIRGDKSTFITPVICQIDKTKGI